MVEWNVLPVDFGAGVDTKTDPKMVVAGKMLRLENGVFTNVKRIAKRNGYNLVTNQVGGVTLVSPKMVHQLNNELLCQDNGNLLSYSPSENAWTPKGLYTSVQLDRFTVDQENLASGNIDSAISGNYAVYVYSTAYNASPTVYSKIYATVVDLQTNQTIGQPYVIATISSAAIGYVKVVKLTTNVFGIVYIKSGITAISIQTLTISGGQVTINSGLSDIATGLTGPIFDIVATSTGATIAYLNQGTGLVLKKINTAGAVTATTTLADTQATAPIVITQNTDGNFWVYWIQAVAAAGTLTGSTIVYGIWNSSLGTVLAPSTVTLPPSPYYVSNMTVQTDSTTQQTLYYGTLITSKASGPGFTDQMNSIVTHSDGTVGAPAVFAYGISPLSKVNTQVVGGVTHSYAVCVYRGTTILKDGSSNFQHQPTYFLMHLSPFLGNPSIPQCVGRFGSGVANSENILGFNALLQNPNYSSQILYNPSLTTISSTKWLFGASIETQSFVGDVFNVSLDGFNGSFGFTFDFNGADCYQAVNSGELAILNGALVHNYDGINCNEWGFHLSPEITTVAASTPGGAAIPNGTYSYLAIFQWTDAQGNLHQSTPSAAVSKTYAGGPSTGTITVTLGFLSQKNNISVALYRTAISGSIYYLITNPAFTVSAVAGGGVTVDIVDNNTDAQITPNPQAYTYPASQVLENTTPPPSMLMIAHNNRLFFVDAEERSQYWYSKTFNPGDGLSPSGFLIQNIDTRAGNITALGEMDDKLIIFKERGLAVQSGDGANDVGSGSTFSNPQFIPTDTGCDNSKSVIQIPTGVMYHTPKGIYLINRAISISYIGMPVESYNSQTISSAQIAYGKSQIRFLCTSGLTLVYDYIFDQWSTFTNHTGISSVVCNGVYYYITTAGSIYSESSSAYTDNGTAFSLLAQTSWLNMSSVQNFQRVRRLAMLGDFTNGASGNHQIQIQAAYDFSSSFSSAIPFTFGSAAASGPFQYRERLPRQKCDTISLLIQEVTTGDSSEFMDLSNISFEAGLKRGLNKLGGQQSVG